MTVHILAISGSLRARSSNTAILQAMRKLAPDSVAITIYGELGALAHFNPDIEIDERLIPPSARALRDAVAKCDGFLVACPEYAHGVPGSFKNALDWLVGCTEFAGKPTSLINIVPRAFHAQSALRETLSTMAVRFVSDAFVSVSLMGLTRSLEAAPPDTDQILANAEIRTILTTAIRRFADAIATIKAETQNGL